MSKFISLVYNQDKVFDYVWKIKKPKKLGASDSGTVVPITPEFIHWKELVHDLKARDYIVIYKDEERRKYVIGVSKETREVSNGESSITTEGLVSSFTNSSSYIYFNQLSDFSIVDEMEEAATPCTPYPYGDATRTGAQVSCELERLSSLQTFRFFDLPIDYIFWI